MRNSSGGRNIRDFVPCQQNFVDIPNYAQIFKSPISNRAKNVKNTIQKLPSFKQNQVPSSTPNSPKDNSFWKTNNGFYQTPNHFAHEIPKEDTKVPQRNSISPQIYSLNRSIFTSEKKSVNQRKYHLQMQVFNDQVLQQNQGTNRNSYKREEQQELFSPSYKRKGGFRNSLHTRTNSRVVDESRTLQITQKSAIETETINKTSFKFMYVLGKGGFGKVWRVEHNKDKKPYAMKEMSKAKIMTKKSVNSVMNERLLLTSLRHPFIANIHFAFQDRETLFLVMDLLTGGDLRFHIGRQRRFTEHQTKFIIACMLLALEYLHKNNIIHRDIKPENIVMDKKGYPRLTDFGIARVVKPENSQETSGTPGYMAPEVMCRQNHSFGVDHFALGVMTYEFMMGRRPYIGKSRREIRDSILAKQVQIKRSEIPIGWSWDAADFINLMLQRKPQQRLGYEGIEEIQGHNWFQGFQWKNLFEKQLASPFFSGSKNEELDFQREVSSDHDSQDQMIQENVMLLRKDTIQDLFLNYQYNDKYIVNTGSTNTTQMNHDKKNRSREYR